MNKKFWKKVLLISIPVAIQNLINTSLNMFDTLMISSLGDDFVSAVGLANKVFFVFNLLTFGIVSGASILTSQYYGKGDEKGLNKAFGLSLLLAVIGAFVFFIFSVSIPEIIMGLFTKSDTLIKIGAPYLRIVSISYIFTAASMAITGLLKSINKTRVPMLVTLGCVLVNVFVNYIYIFGAFGAPRLEATGAAIGTVVARGIEIILLALYLIFTKKSFKLNLKEMLSYNKPFIAKISKLAIPVLFNEFAWGLGTTIYSVIYGHMSNEVVAAMTVGAILQDLTFAFLLGISNAASVIVGNELGASKFDDAKKTAKILLITNFILGIILSFIVVLLMHPYLKIYDNISDTVKNYVISITIVYALFIPFKAFNLTTVCGILRSGGDSVFCLLLDLGGVWAIGIPLGLLSAFVFNLNIAWVFAFILLEEPVKFVIGYIRYKSKKWVRNVTEYNNELEASN